nr:retrovirus-related Pol polyprotein from transposon TNT 1-94 [Tanacetum cinerariifolium]
YQNEVNELRAEKLARNTNPLALVATAQASQDQYYQTSRSHRSSAPSPKPSILSRSQTTTRHKGKEIAKPITPTSETDFEEDSDPKQAHRDKDMQNNLALIAKTVNVAGIREKVGSPIVQKSGIQCFNYKEYGHFAKEYRKPKGLRTPRTTRKRCCCADKLSKNEQNDVESDDERVTLVNLIANLKLDVDENKKTQKQLKKSNTTHAQELKECKTILAETSKTNAKLQFDCMSLRLIGTRPGDCVCSKGNVKDNILVLKPPKNYARCTRCGYLVDGPNCQGCALLRQELEENLVTHSPNFRNTSDPSNASTNVVNAHREPYVVKQDHGSFVDKIIFDLNRSPDSPHLHTISPNQFRYFHCKDVLRDREACKRCTCAKCGSGLGKGLCYICGHNQNSLNVSPSISETSSQSPPHINHCCYECVLVSSNPKPCNNQTIDELPQTLPSFHPTFHSEAESPFTLDSTPTYVDEFSNIFNLPPQPPMYPCEFYGNDAYYGHYCTPQAPFIYPEPCYNQEFNFLTLAKITEQMTSITSLCDMACKVVQKKLEEKQLEKERAAKAQNWKLPVCYDDEDYTSAITPDEPVLSTEEPDNSLSKGDEHLDTIPATESDEFIKSGVENLIPIPSESEGIPQHVCDVPSHDNSPPLDVLKDQIEDFSESNKEFSSIDDDSFFIDNIDYTQSDSLKFVHELKQEMHADLKYVESLEKEIDKLASDKLNFQTYALDELQCLYLHKVKECNCLAQKLSKQTESVSKKDHTELLQRFAKVEKHSISLELALQKCKEQEKNDTVCNEKASNVFRKKREQYFKIQDLKAKLQDKNIAIRSQHVLLEIFRDTPTQAWLWHRRLSHLNFDYINLLSKKDIMISLPKLKYVKDQLCSSCELSKAKRISFNSKVVPSSKGRLNLIHMDLCGPMRVASINEKKYILVIVDDYSRDGENSDKMKEKGDQCILVGYTTQSKGYRVYNKRTRMIVKSIHILFDEIKEVLETSVANNTSGLIPQLQKASDYDNPDPVPQRQDVYSSTDADVPSQQELDILLGPLYDEFFNAGSNPSTNIQSTSAPSTHTNVNAEENNNDQEEEGEHIPDDEFTNLFYALDTRNHPLEQVHGNPSRPVQTRRQLATDPEMCMYALTVSTAEPKNIKEAMADSEWIEVMQDKLHLFDR